MNKGSSLKNLYWHIARLELLMEHTLKQYGHCYLRRKVLLLMIHSELLRARSRLGANIFGALLKKMKLIHKDFLNFRNEEKITGQLEKQPFYCLELIVPLCQVWAQDNLPFLLPSLLGLGSVLDDLR